ncbi:hypothetical protein ACS0TY_026729 [Phlomoides rotata]
MYSKTQLFLSLNLLFYILCANGCGTCNNPSSPTHTPPNNGPGKGGSSSGGNNGGGNGGGNNGGGNGGGSGGGNNGGGSLPRCPRDALKLGVCANVLGLVNVVVGSPPTLPCCTLLAGLVDLEAAVCLCTAIRANVLGINLNLPINLSLLLNVCGRTPPTGFVC